MSKRNKLMLFAVAAVLASSAQVSADDTFYIIRDGQGPCKVVEGHPPGTVTIIRWTFTDVPELTVCHRVDAPWVSGRSRPAAADEVKRITAAALDLFS